MNELKVHVERAVRPVRAFAGRKLKMREELLAHLTAIYEDERAKLGDDSLALHQSLQRFGDVAELTRELQATVPRLEQILTIRLLDWGGEQRTVRWFYPRAGESAFRHAARVSTMFAGFILANVAMIPLLRFASGVSWSALRIDYAAAAVVTAHAFVSAMLFIGFYRATSGRLTIRAVVAAFACGTALLAGGPVLLGALHVLQEDNPLWLDLIQTKGRLSRVILSGLFWLLICVVGLRYALDRQRQILEWARLEIE